MKAEAEEMTEEMAEEELEEGAEEEAAKAASRATALLAWKGTICNYTQWESILWMSNRLDVHIPS